MEPRYSLPRRHQAARRAMRKRRALSAHIPNKPSSVTRPTAPPPPPELGAGVGSGKLAAVTVSVVDVGADGPTTLVQNRMYVSVPTAVGVTVSLPVAARAPVQLPDAVQP